MSLLLLLSVIIISIIMWILIQHSVPQRKTFLLFLFLSKCLGSPWEGTSTKIGKGGRFFFKQKKRPSSPSPFYLLTGKNGTASSWAEFCAFSKGKIRSDLWFGFGIISMSIIIYYYYYYCYDELLWLLLLLSIIIVVITKSYYYHYYYLLLLLVLLCES